MYASVLIYIFWIFNWLGCPYPGQSMICEWSTMWYMIRPHICLLLAMLQFIYNTLWNLIEALCFWCDWLIGAVSHGIKFFKTIKSILFIFTSTYIFFWFPVDSLFYLLTEKHYSSEVHALQLMNSINPMHTFEYAILIIHYREPNTVTYWCIYLTYLSIGVGYTRSCSLINFGTPWFFEKCYSDNNFFDWLRIH